MKPLHQLLNLYTEENDTYIFAPDGGSQTLTIHRTSGDITLNHLKAPLPISARRTGKPVYGILGLLSLTLSEYIITVTGRELQGRFMGNDIYRCTNFDVMPLNPHVNAHNPPHPVEAHLLALVRSHLYGGNFLFSYTWDLTRRLQVQWENYDRDEDKPLWKLVDERFFWNSFLQSRFIEITNTDIKQDLGAYILPIMYGTFDIRPVFIHGHHMLLCLISRRSRFRAGTRYFRRGIDHEGHVANFNESEQIVLIEGKPAAGGSGTFGGNFSTKLSFVQIRGSVPMFWAEINTLRYKPDLQIMDLPETTKAMHKHLSCLRETYGSQALVNLVNQVGYERPIKDAYERYFSQIQPQIPDARYEYFDFHRECRNMRWDRISVLIDKLRNDIDQHGYFHLSADSPGPRTQTGVIRTNCMDNLDRTNVVQAAFAKWTLTVQLRDLGILPPDAGVDDYDDFSKDFREMWADHADAIARAYGGSGALKSDFTRTNKRTKQGVVEDGLKSVLRYIKNTFFDGPRQDGFDLITGAYVPRKNLSAAVFLISDPRPLITRSMAPTASFSLFMICAGLTLPRSSDYSLFYYFILWFMIFAVSFMFILIHGIDYVSWPRLLPPTDVIYYSGPGFRSAHHGKGLKATSEPGQRRSAWICATRVRTGVEEVELGTMKKRLD